MENTYLFVDWVHVDKGRMEVTLDADRLSPEGKEFVERYEREWSIYRDFSGTPRAVSLSITPAGHGTLQNAGNIAVRMGKQRRQLPDHSRVRRAHPRGRVYARAGDGIGIAVNNLLNIYPDKIESKGDVLTDLGGRFQYPWEVNQFGFNGVTGSGRVHVRF